MTLFTPSKRLFTPKLFTICHKGITLNVNVFIKGSCMYE